MKFMMYWKLPALVLITVYLFGCSEGYDIGSGPGIVTEIVPGTTDPDTVVQKPAGDEQTGDDQDTMPEVEKPELNIDAIDGISDDIEVPVGPPVIPPPDSDPPEIIDSNPEIPRLDIDDIEEILDDIEVPVGPPVIPPSDKIERPRDSKPPEIIDSNIEDGAEDVGRSSVIWITFNEPVVDGDLRLRIKRGDTVKTRVNYGNQTVHLERLGKDIVMKPLTTYVIEGTVSDAAGNETEVELTFTTSEENF